MTPEEKAKAYDEALERAKSFQQKFGGDYAGYIFPELRESEDEKIRRTLVKYFGPVVQLDFIRGVPIQKVRDWLERQKEHKPSKEQMLKEAVEGSIRSFGIHNAICIKDPGWTEKLDKYKDGDKVLVIVLPKEAEK